MWTVSGVWCSKGRCTWTFTLPVLMKDEEKYADVVDVLAQLEDCVKGISVKTWLCVLPPIAAPSRPDQLVSHIPLVRQAEDLLANVTILCFLSQKSETCRGKRSESWEPHWITDWITHILFERSFPKVTYFGNQFFFSTNLVPRVSPLPIPWSSNGQEEERLGNGAKKGVLKVSFPCN